MVYILQFTRILVFCFLGEVLHRLLPFPIPASIYGMVLLLLALKLGIVRTEQVKKTGNFLTGIFPLLFVPGAVGVMEQAAVLRESWPAIVIALIPVTLLVFAVTGKITEHFAEGPHA